MRHTLTHGNHLTDAFQAQFFAEVRSLQIALRQHVHNLHDVFEVDGADVYPDFDLVTSRWNAFAFLKLKTVHQSWRWDLQRVGGCRPGDGHFVFSLHGSL